jgi:hypothetical protein
MMFHMGIHADIEFSPSGAADLSGMPRSGPDACWLDRLLQTDRP